MREAVDAEVAAREAATDVRQIKEMSTRQIVSELYTIWASAHVVTESSTSSNFEQFTRVMREILRAAVSQTRIAPSLKLTAMTKTTRTTTRTTTVTQGSRLTLKTILVTATQGLQATTRLRLSIHGITNKIAINRTLQVLA